MAHFARLKNNIVIDVVVIADNDIKNTKGIESEQIGIKFCQSLWGNEFEYLQTSYNGKIRKNYAGIGFSYDKERDVFIAPKPSEDSIFNEITFQWEVKSEK